MGEEVSTDAGKGSASAGAGGGWSDSLASFGHFFIVVLYCIVYLVEGITNAYVYLCMWRY